MLPPSPRTDSYCLNYMDDEHGTDDAAPTERLNASLAEIERLTDEKNTVHGVVRHLRRTILDLSLQRDCWKDKSGVSGYNTSGLHKTTTTHAKDRSTQTDQTESSMPTNP